MLEYSISLKPAMNKLFDERGYKASLVKKLNFKGHSTLSKFANNDLKEIDDFKNLVLVASEMFPDKAEDYIIEYCEALSHKSKDLKCALEYASSNQLKKLKSYLIEKTPRSTHQEVKDAAKLYEIYSDIKKDSFVNSLDKLSKVNSENVDNQIFSKIVTAHVYHQQGMYTAMSEMIRIADVLMNDKDVTPYLKDSYKSRLSSLKVSYKLAQGNVEEIIQSGLDALKEDIDSRFNIWILMNMGNAAMLKSHEESMKYLQMAKFEAESRNDLEKLREIERSITFSNCYWKKKVNPSTINGVEITDLHNKAFAYISNDQTEEALEILNSIDVEKLNSDRKSFYYFYKGMATRSKEDFYKSIQFFNEIGDKHYRQLSINELRKLGENEVLLQTLSS
ncbi:AimR family lysis-lysogeny pheromone receptor [Priestia megaterium]|uniref:AimR family lysis-lysogeny pheromone receptor n=1 Tax=Priestia megaterium TaxID=1404 RepID=UPI00112A927E|nr:AimR family lysis-lysogeny pheromone receptor [Priestia megaterium]TPF18005.1 hypothetical protein CBE78_01915 [Priestia megaterium]TPF22112.1 hypothetical protein CBE79_04420 [Priestia megaterium]